MLDGYRASRSARPIALPAALVLALAMLLAGAGDARAQAGMEAAAATKQATDWSKQQKQSGTQGALPRARVVPPRRGKVAPAVPALPPRKPSGAPGRVAGTVVEKGTRLGVAGVILSLTSTEPQFAVETLLARSDSSGHYEFPSVEPGRWSLVVVRDQVPKTYGALAGARVVTVAKRDNLAEPPIELGRTACVSGHVVWSDGYVFSDAPVRVAPRDPVLLPAEGALNGIGDYEICTAPADTVMVWLALRDGRRLGRPARLTPGSEAVVDFRPVPLEQIEGSLVRFEPRTPDGRPVLKAKILVVGRKLAVGDEPTLVFAREAVADHAGGADFWMPYGTYEILVVNPREGPYGRVEQFVIAPGAPPKVVHEVILRGTSTAEDRAAWRTDMLERADRFERVWVP
jgi:hypothetical protein